MITGIIELNTDGDLALAYPKGELKARYIRITRPTEDEVLASAAYFLSNVTIIRTKYDSLTLKTKFENAIKQLIQDLSEDFNRFEENLGNQSISFKIVEEEELVI